MKDVLESYIQSISSKFSHEETSELGYRSDFEILLQKIFESVKIRRINHDAKATEGNKPDFAVLSGDVPLVYIETKDIGVSLDKIEKSEQMGRYYGYANLVLTDYVEFRFYRNGLVYGEPVKIANYDIRTRSIDPITDNYELLAKTLLEFTQSYKEPIKSGKHLSKIMAGKAQRIRDNIRQFLSAELENKTELVKLFESIKKFLVHDLSVDSFADMYAQTLVYGLFIARFNDTTLDSFTRSEARDLIPNSNPFLHRFFDHIAGTDFDSRLKFIVDELCEVFSHSNIEELLKEFSNEDLWGKTHKKPDPVIYFYEDFLKEYDPVLRKKMGAYYTPEPVVQFIVKAVDSILKSDFKLGGGLRDTSKTTTGLHKVQILDPATGTGTFISAVIRSIYKFFKTNKQEGGWPSYVQNDLLPRLYGFEIMMAPYTIAHLKLSMAFRETKFKYFNSKRLGIYLTNSLEGELQQQGLFAGVGLSESIAEESIEASKIKNDKPIMIVIGNPPYSGVSSNETDYANKLVEKYKVEPGGREKLHERKHWLNDDYVKFIAFAESMIEKNREGIVAFITNHGYLDNPTFRGMRWKLMDTFDSIYLIDLHGNSNKNELSPDGSKDENVFDIQQGVSIMLAIKTGKKIKGNLAKIYKHDIWGKRESKFEQLNNAILEDISWNLLNPRLPNLFFTNDVSQDLEAEYKNKGFSVDDLFLVNTSGIVTMGDGFIVNENKKVLENRIINFFDNNISTDTLTSTFNLGKNYAKWINENKKLISVDLNKITEYLYRPFDTRYSYFDNKLVWRPRTLIMKHLLKKNNLGLIVPKQLSPGENAGAFVTRSIGGHKTFSAYNSNYYFPLYLYDVNGSKIPNLKKEIVSEIEKLVGNVSPEDLVDYVYAVLHSSNYLKKYIVFLKINFPRIPYPKNKDEFYKLVKFGNELRLLHLLESPKVNNFITSYNIEGSDIVEKILYKDGDVYINETQYFGDVPEVAWNFYIGGYQPAQRWLKDRKGKKLINEDVEHYQKIIIALVETSKVQQQIDKIYENHN